MISIEDILEPYSKLERDVSRVMKDLFSGMCGMCTACCCRVDICEETLASPFLSRLISKQGLDESKLDDRYGWLDLGGCSLEYGRPPICYAYFCDSLLARLPDDESRLTARTLGNLMDHIGQAVIGEQHLVELMNPDDLNAVSGELIMERIEEARAAFDVIREFLHTGRLDASGHEALLAIRSVEH